MEEIIGIKEGSIKGIKIEALRSYRLDNLSIRILEADKNRKGLIVRLEVIKENNKALDGEKINKNIDTFIDKVVDSFFYKGDFFKLVLIISKEIDINKFINKGFDLEGLLRNQDYNMGLFNDEYIIATDAISFRERKNNPYIELKGKRINLKIASPANAKELLEYFIYNKDFLKAFEPQRSDAFYTLRAQEKELSVRYKLFLNGQMVPFLIYKDDKLIGRINVSNIVLGSFRSCTIGYGLHKDYLKEGLMTEAVSLVKNFCFKEMKLHRIEASTLVDNIASQKVLLNNGFTKIGLNPSYLKIGGKWCDHISFSLINNL